MKFKKLTVSCSSEVSDIVAYTLHECGSMGEVFDDYNIIKQVLDEKRWDYADKDLFEATDGCSVSGFFTIEENTAGVRTRIYELKNNAWADFSTLSVSEEIIDSAEWEDEWKKYYKPFNIGKIVVVPEWIDYTPKADEIPVKLNPGPAFGTGTHETTSMCIDLMQKIPVKGANVYDLGCGSGILGICAQALGAKSISFADLDEQAVSATRYNCKLNGILNPNLVQEDVRALSPNVDIIIANITADVLMGIESSVYAALSDYDGLGYAIISGIISEKEDDVKACYEQHFELVETVKKNEWRAMLFKLL